MILRVGIRNQKLESEVISSLENAETGPRIGRFSEQEAGIRNQKSEGIDSLKNADTASLNQF